jgi:quercetin dioxygenase-like cupin family protein
MTLAEAKSAPFPTIVTAFGYSPLAPALWRTDPDTGLEYRDLSLAQASEDAFVGRHLRTAGVRVHTNTLIGPETAFAFLFVLAGRVTLREQGGEPITLHALDCATRHGPGKPVDIVMSHDAELVEMKASAHGGSQFGSGDGEWRINREEEDAYVRGDGPRAYFRYRDLGVAEATARRIHIHVVRATQSMDGGTGWHSHSMGQLFYVLRGWAGLQVERRPAVRLAAGDAMCVAKRMRHNVPAFSADYLVLEMCIPADYDTIDAEPA